jgi:hypothetical protein
MPIVRSLLALSVRAVFGTATLLPPFPCATAQACFDATFDAGVRANTAERFQAKSN